MIKIDSNYHTHIALCLHAEGEIVDYIERAIKCNYQEIGISDHAPLSAEVLSKVNTRRMNFFEYENLYLPDLKRAKEKYRERIKVWSGLEVEYFEEMEEYYQRFLNDVDYLILGQHYLKNKKGHYFGIYGQMNEEELDNYATTVEFALRKGYFKILAHPEIYLFNNPLWNKKAIEVANRIIDVAIECDVFLEMNANGIRRPSFLNEQGEVVYKYPRLEFWRLVKTKKAKVIISDDCHRVEHLYDEATLIAYQMAKDLGIDYVKRIF